MTLATLFGRHFTPQGQREVVAAGERLYVNITPALRHAQGRTVVRAIFDAIEPGTGQAIASLLDDPRLAVNRSRLSPQATASLARIASVVARRAAAAVRDPQAQRADLQRRIDAFVADVDARSRAARTIGERLALWQASYEGFAGQLSLRLLPLAAAGKLLNSIETGNQKVA